MIPDTDIKYMRMALSLAKKGAGSVSPNPLVGAILVKNDKLISNGYHARFGGPHAEINAIQGAVEPVRGATLYCTLEPCSHTKKKTPPCAQRIIKEGIKRVVIGSIDPNPKVSGKSIRMLRAAGIEAKSGILSAECDELNRFFFKYITRGVPYITVKIAQTIDGKISREPGRQIWITGKKSQRLVHKWRSEFDAVLVGAGTIRTDNPQLTVREIRGRNPFRIVLTNSLDLPPESLIFSLKDSEKTIIYTGVETTTPGYTKIKPIGIDVVYIKKGPDQLKHILSDLAKRKIASVLVEGGQNVFSQFITSDLVDELQVFIAPKLFGHGVASFLSTGDYRSEFYLHKARKVGEDMLLTYCRKEDLVVSS